MLVIFLTIAVSWYTQDKPIMKDRLILRPYLVVEQGQLYRLISHAFVHADFTHLGFNMFVLWQFGSLIEVMLEQDQLTGWFNMSAPSFLMLYAGGVLAGAVPAIAKHSKNMGYASLGASGGVSAVMMAYILLFPTHKLLLFFVIPMPAFVAGILFFAYERFMNQKGGTGIAHDAHLMGATFGGLFVLLFDQSTIPRLVEAFGLLVSNG